jgi:WhiB family redox-sensing transcriptional regulator
MADVLSSGTESRVVLSWETMLGPPPAWYAYAACRDHGSRVWFRGTRTAARAAIETCQDCPARAECLEYALTHVELVGVWGGHTFEDRLRIRRERRENADASPGSQW